MISRNHRLSQLLCLLFCSALLWPMPFWKGAPRAVVQASPFVAICYGFLERSVSFGAGIGLALALVGILRKRFFCKYICPTGLLLDSFSKIGFNKSAWWIRCPRLGQYAALLTIASAFIGYPVFLWMDPLAIFSSSLTIRTASGLLSGVFAGLTLGILALLTATSGSIWCARLCPLGGILDLLPSVKSWFKFRGKTAQSRAPSLVSGHSESFGGRRAFICLVAGVGLGLAAKRLGSAHYDNAPLRPPGAVPEERFTSVCVRCGNCLRACPTKIIHPDIFQAGLRGVLAPVIRYANQYCLEDCNACTQVCPSGAIQSLDLKQKLSYAIGEALVDGSLCILALGERECDACKRACPFDAIAIHWDDEQYIAYPLVDPKKCNGCGACEVACPTNDIKAIRVWKLLH